MPSAAEIDAAFAAHDTDGSGRIEVTELGAALAQLGVSVDSNELARLLDGADLDGDGALGPAEFRTLFDASRLRAAFNELDIDGSGSITIDELMTALAQGGHRGAVGRKAAAAVLGRVDQDGDGRVSFAEFRAAFQFAPEATAAAVVAQWSALGTMDVGTDLAPPLPEPGVPLMYAPCIPRPPRLPETLDSHPRRM